MRAKFRTVRARVVHSSGQSSRYGMRLWRFSQDRTPVPSGPDGHHHLAHRHHHLAGRPSMSRPRTYPDPDRVLLVGVGCFVLAAVVGVVAWLAGGG